MPEIHGHATETNRPEGKMGLAAGVKLSGS